MKKITFEEYQSRISETETTYDEAAITTEDKITLKNSLEYLRGIASHLDIKKKDIFYNKNTRYKEIIDTSKDLHKQSEREKGLLHASLGMITETEELFFSKENALNRNLEAERKVLENK